MSQAIHSERKHSRYSASGAERWVNCPGSVTLSEGLPDKSTPWSIEGTKGHEVLEQIMQAAISIGATKIGHVSFPKSVPQEMKAHGLNAANFMLRKYKEARNAELLVETRIALPFIHPDMFGTFDGAVVEHFGMLNVFDYKYGQGHSVSPGTPENPNLQMAIYGIGLAAKYDWNFKRARLWIIQPRIRGYDGPTFVELPILKLKAMVPMFQDAVKRTERQPRKYVEGSWCHWCKAKAICPLKREAKLEQAKGTFSSTPL